MTGIAQYKDVNIFPRLAAVYYFMLEGSLMGLWACYIPDIQKDLGLSDGQLGTASLLMFLGTVLATNLAGWLTKHYGSRASTFIGGICFALTLPLVGIAPNFVFLCIAMFSYGYCMGILDVSMNGIAVLTEMVAQKPLLSSYHGCYPIAAAIASVVGGALNSAGYGAVGVFSVAAAITLLLSSVGCYFSYSLEEETHITSLHNEDHHHEDSDVGGDEDTDAADTIAKRSHYILLLQNSDFLYFGLVGFLASLGESGMTTWVIVYFDRYFDAGTFASSVGFGVFMVCMGVCRFLGDKMREWYGRRTVFHYNGVLVVLGLTVMVISPSAPDAFNLYIGYMGAGMTGMGLATCIPTVFSSAGHLPNVHPGSAIGLAAAMTYSGSIVGPILLGGASQLFDSLRSAYILDDALLCGILIFSFKIPEETSKWYASEDISGHGNDEVTESLLHNDQTEAESVNNSVYRNSL